MTKSIQWLQCTLSVKKTHNDIVFLLELLYRKRTDGDKYDK